MSSGNGPGQRDHESSKYGGDNVKKCNGVAERAPILFFLFFTETASDEDGNRCGHGGGREITHVEKRAAGGDARMSGGGCRLLPWDLTADTRTDPPAD